MTEVGRLQAKSRTRMIYAILIALTLSACTTQQCTMDQWLVHQNCR